MYKIFNSWEICRLLLGTAAVTLGIGNVRVSDDDDDDALY